jgi:hypothetical protein
VIDLVGRLVAAILPIGLFAALLWETRRRDAYREPWLRLLVTFVLGMAAQTAATLLVARAARLTGLDVRVSEVGSSGALVFAFFVVAPLEEAGTFAAVWPSLLAKRFDQPFDGVAYATASALGCATVEALAALHAQSRGVWIARVILALPAHVFCASLWGYALGRARPSRRRRSLFPLAFVASTVAHGLYTYFVYGRGPGALLALTPILLAMGFVSWLLSRDLVARHELHALTPPSSRRSRLSLLSQPPSLATVRAALRAGNEPVRLGWIAFGAVVTFGAMIVGLLAGAIATRLLHVDLAAVEERDIRSSAPVLFLGAGLLASFPVSGWLIARAAGVHTLLEPALAAMLGLLLAAVTLGFAAPSTVVFALAVSPMAWLLSCLGAWAGRSV